LNPEPSSGCQERWQGREQRRRRRRERAGTACGADNYDITRGRVGGCIRPPIGQRPPTKHHAANPRGWGWGGRRSGRRGLPRGTCGAAGTGTL